MLERWGWFVVRHAKGVLVVALLAALGSAFATVDLPGRLSLTLFENPGSDSDRGQEVLEREFGVSPPNLVLVVTARSGSVEDPAVVAEAGDLVTRLAAEPGVVDVASYWSLGRADSLRSRGGDRGLVVARVEGDDRAVHDRLGDLSPRYGREGVAIDVRVGGLADTMRSLLDITFDEIERAELITVPVTLVALLFVFGSAVAATLPLVIAFGALLGTGLGLWVLAGLMPITFFAPLLTSALALGLGIDYSLFIVSRFREEMAAGHDPDEAIVRTLRTAGRTVLFSAAAVGIALSALALMPLAFMQAFAYAFVLTAVSAGIAALVVLPAALVFLGPNINRFTVWRRSAQAGGSGAWHRVAVTVMRRPVRVGGALIAVLLVLSFPALRMSTGMLDERDLPEKSAGRTTGKIIRTEFDAEVSTPLEVVLPGTDPVARAGEIDRFARGLAGLPHVRQVVGPGGRYAGADRMDLPAGLLARYQRPGAAYLDVITDADPRSKESDRLIEAIRSRPAPFPRLHVAGEAATAHDVLNGMLDALPRVLAFIITAAGLALFIQFGGVLVPIKAILLNLLSLAALFGVLVWGFQDGHLGGLLGFTATGQIYIVGPLLLACLAFGLSMDYELFLLSRIKEEYDRSADNERAVALGLERSGRIVSAAAILISACFVSMALTSSLTFMKMLGLGLAAVVLLDAFVIRATLVPAFMKLAGEANWWAPKSLRRLHDRIGISEHVDLDETNAVPAETCA